MSNKNNKAVAVQQHDDSTEYESDPEQQQTMQYLLNS